MEKLIKVIGKGWKKRSIHFDKVSLAAQFNLMIYAFKYYLGDSSKKADIESCIELIKTHTPEE